MTQLKTSLQSTLDQITQANDPEHWFQSVAVSSALNRTCLAVFDGSGQLLDANREFLAFCGKQKSDKSHFDTLLQEHSKQTFAQLIKKPGFAGNLRKLLDGQAVFDTLSCTLTHSIAPNQKDLYILSGYDITECVVSTQYLGLLESQTESMDTAYLLYDESGNILRFSANAARVLGHTNAKLDAQNIRNFVHPKTLESSEFKTLWQGLSTGDELKAELAFVNDSGLEIWLASKFSAITQGAKRERVIFHEIKDITQIHITRLHNQAKLKAIEENSAVIEFNTDGTIFHANDNFLATTAYTLDEIVGQHHRIFVDDTYAQSQEYQNFWLNLQQGKVQKGTFKRYNKHGDTIYLFASYTPVKNLNGDVIKIIKFASDVTASTIKDIESKGKISALDKSQAIIEFAPDATILSANQNFLNTTGYKLSEIQGKPHSIFVSSEYSRSAEYLQFWEDLNRGTPIVNEFVRYKKSGELFHIAGSYNPIYDLDGKLLKIVKFCTDITKSKIRRIETQAMRQAIERNNCVVKLNTQHQIKYTNPLLAELLGYSVEELTGKDESEIRFDDHESNQQFAEIWRKAKSGKAQHVEFRRKHKNGEELWLDVVIQPIFDEQDELFEVLIVGRDFTEQKLSRIEVNGKINAIERSQAVIEFNTDGTILSANKNFLDLMGYSLQSIQGQHHKIFVDPAEVQSSEYQVFWNSLSRGEFRSGEFKRITQDGREVWIQATYNPVFDLNNKPIKVVKFASDITAQKLANAEYQSRDKAINANLACIEFDLEGNVLHANHNFLAAMGYTLKEIVGSHHSIFCSGDYTRSEEYRTFWLKLSEGEAKSGRFHRLGKFNRNVWIQASYNPIYDLNGNIVKVIKVAYDITKEMEIQQLVTQHSKNMSEQLVKLLASIQDVAHESETANDHAVSSVSHANKGLDNVKEMSAAMLRIQKSYEEVADIVTQISDIAGQTNLLAFNAAVEAARAGTQGVGFSVVAAEVRKLAERSASAAEQIGKMVKATQNDINSGCQLSETTFRIFDEIESSIKETSASLHSIVDLTRDQQRSTDQFESTISELQIAVDSARHS